MIEVRHIIPSLPVEDCLDEYLFEQLMRKFELNKKLYRSYDDDFIKSATEQEISDNEYSKLAACFCKLADQQNDIRFYNTALKISDRVTIELPEIKF